MSGTFELPCVVVLRFFVGHFANLLKSHFKKINCHLTPHGFSESGREGDGKSERGRFFCQSSLVWPERQTRITIIALSQILTSLTHTHTSRCFKLYGLKCFSFCFGEAGRLCPPRSHPRYAKSFLLWLKMGSKIIKFYVQFVQKKKDCKFISLLLYERPSAAAARWWLAVDGGIV